MNSNVSTVVSFDPEVKALLDRLASDIQALQLRAKLTMVERQAPGEPVEMESSARQRLKDDADATAQRMVAGFDLMKQQGQSTATSLAYALRVVRQASAGFECSQTMEAILHALDGMDAAAREEQSNG